MPKATLLLCLLAGTAFADRDVYQIENNALVVPKTVDVADYVKGYLEQKAAITLLRIEAHTDNLGDAKQNQAASEQRARAMARTLVARGIDCKRVLAVGFGASKPIAANDTAEGRARNRRFAFVNAALRGRAIGGLSADGGGVVAGDACK